MPAAVVSGPAVTPVRLPVSPGTAEGGWLVTGDPGPGRTASGAPWATRWTVPLTPDAAVAVAGAGGALLAELATVRATDRATVPVTLPVPPCTTLDADGAEAGGSGWL
jgi:hypothetical protein